MARYPAVFFDFDDTLIDSYDVRYRAAEIAADGILDPAIDLKQVMREWASRPQFEIWLHLTGSEEKALEMQAAYRKWYWSEGTELVSVYPGVPAMLDELKANGVTLVIVTSKTRLKYDDGKPWGATVEIGRLGLDGLFTMVVGEEDTSDSKPAPGPVLFALRELGLRAGDVLMVGDSHIDVGAAKAAGVASAGAVWGTIAREMLLKSEPDYLPESPADVCSLVL